MEQIFTTACESMQMLGYYVKYNDARWWSSILFFLGEKQYVNDTPISLDEIEQHAKNILEAVAVAKQLK